MPKGFDRLSLRSNLLVNKENGVWSGWVYAQRLEERKFMNPIFAFYFRVDKYNCGLYTKFTDKNV